MPESETRRRNSGAGVTEPVEEKLRTAARASSQQLTNPERYRKEAKDWWRLPEAQYDMSPQRIGPVILETAYMISIFLFLMWWMSVSPEFEDTRKGLLLEFGYYLIVLIGSSTACFAMFGDGLKRMFWTLPSEVPLGWASPSSTARPSRTRTRPPRRPPATWRSSDEPGCAGPSASACTRL